MKRSTVTLLFSLLLLPAGFARGQESFEVVGGLGEKVDAELTGRALELLKRRDETIAGLDSPARVQERQRYVRDRFARSLGGFPRRTPQNARITRTLDRDGYRVEMLVYESLPGFAHGFCVLSNRVHVEYKCTDCYAPEGEITVAWNDAEVGVEWPLQEPVLSTRDAAAPRLAQLLERLPTYPG